MIRVLSLVAALATVAAAQVEKFQFDVKTLGGRHITHEDFKDSVLIVDLWGTWCPPCRAAIPELMELYGKYKHQGLEIVGFNYERVKPQDAADTVRKFAAQHRVTYTLALGDDRIQSQVLGFSGYPTLLFFKKGLRFDHMEVGFQAGHGKTIEAWIRTQLGLESEAGVPAPAPGGDEEEGGGEAPAPKPDLKPKPEPKPVKVGPSLEKGVIYQPGDGDAGFDFDLVDPDGKPVRFADRKGKVTAVPLLLAGDAASARLASALATLETKYGDQGLSVVGVCFGRSKDLARKQDEVRGFGQQHQLGFPLGVAELSFIKKVHNAGGFPLLLVFDRSQVLKVRLTGMSKETEDGLEKRLRDVLGLDV